MSLEEGGEWGEGSKVEVCEIREIMRANLITSEFYLEFRRQVISILSLVSSFYKSIPTPFKCHILCSERSTMKAFSSPDPHCAYILDLPSQPHPYTGLYQCCNNRVQESDYVKSLRFCDYNWLIFRGHLLPFRTQSLVSRISVRIRRKTNVGFSYWYVSPLRSLLRR